MSRQASAACLCSASAGSSSARPRLKARPPKRRGAREAVWRNSSSSRRPGERPGPGLRPSRAAASRRKPERGGAGGGAGGATAARAGAGGAPPSQRHSSPRPRRRPRPSACRSAMAEPGPGLEWNGTARHGSALGMAGAFVTTTDGRSSRGLGPPQGLARKDGRHGALGHVQSARNVPRAGSGSRGEGAARERVRDHVMWEQDRKRAQCV